MPARATRRRTARPQRAATPTAGASRTGVGSRSRRMFRGETAVVPAKAGTHTPSLDDYDRRSNKYTGVTRNIGDTAYGSPPSRGRQPAHASNMMTLRTVLPAFIAAKPSLI